MQVLTKPLDAVPTPRQIVFSRELLNITGFREAE
jgi:hypothetical protein